MTSIDFYAMQVCQHSHDMGYHNDILSLGTEARVKHLVLHFAKYLWRLLENNFNEKEIADITICSLSLANALNFKIAFNKGEPQLEIDSIQHFIRAYSIAIGKMSKACEALDHLESYPSHDELIVQVKNILCVMVSYSKMNNIDLVNIVKNRILQVEQASLFGTYIQDGSINIMPLQSRGNL